MNGGTGTFDDQMKMYNTPLYLSTSVPSRSDYDFLGWAESADATTAEYQPGDIFTEEGDFTLFAVWRDNNVHVHTLTLHAKVEPTCTEAGMNAYWSCDTCEKLFSDQDATEEINTPVSIAAQGHNWGSPTYTWIDEDSKVTATSRCTRDASHEETETANVVVVLTPPTEETDGAQVYSAIFSNKIFIEQQKTIAVPALKNMNVLRLPSFLTTIETEAFDGIAAEAVIIPDGCTTIEPKAFTNCTNLLYIRIPTGVIIPEDAFTGCPNVVIDQR